MVCFLKITGLCDPGQRTQFFPGTQFSNLLLEKNVNFWRPGAMFYESAPWPRTMAVMGQALITICWIEFSAGGQRAWLDDFLRYIPGLRATILHEKNNYSDEKKVLSKS